MGAGRIAGVAGAIAVVAIGAFLLWSAGPAAPPVAPPSAPGAAVVPPAPAPGFAPAEGSAGAAVPSAPAADGSSAAPSASQPAAPAGPGRIAGRITWMQDQATPVPEVLVLLARGPEGSTDVVAKTRTDAEGRFSFSGVALGEHSFCTLTREEEPWDYEHATATVEDGKTAEVQLWVERPLPAGTGIRVAGTVRYEDGRIPRGFHFEFYEENQQYIVSGIDGAFARRLPGAGKYSVWSVQADGREYDDLDLEVDIVEGTPVAIVLPVEKDAALTVASRASGAPLPGALVYRRIDEPGHNSHYDNPGRATLAGEPLRADAQGRVALGRGVGSETVYVIAEGHAWRRFEVTRGGDGPARVLLEPGGSLRLTVENWAALVEARISAERSDPDRRWYLPPPGEDGGAIYPGVPVGAWTLRVRRGRQWQDGELYGEGQATVAAGEESALTIAARPPEVRAPVGVIGTVSIPAEWKRQDTRLEFEGAEPTNVEVERSARIAIAANGAPVPFVLKPLPPGRYHVTIEPQYYETVTVPEEGGVFHFKLPPPGTVLLRVVDDVTDAPIERARVWWHTAAQERRSYTLENAVREDAPGVYRITAPAGRIQVSVSAAGCAEDDLGGRGLVDEEGGLAVTAGSETTITVRMKRAGRVRVALKCEGEPPAWDDVNAHLVREAGTDDEDWHWLAVSRGSASTDDALPGTWELRIEGLEEEFEALPPRSVTVAAGETATLEVTLVRKK